MLNRAFAIAATLCLVCAIAVAPVRAQSGNFRVKVPFAFTCGSVQLPAGEYALRRVGPSLFSLRGGDASILVTCAVVAGDGRTSGPEVFFNQYGGEYFLSALQAEPSGRRYTFARSGAEVALAKARVDRNVVALAAK